jgi:K(+)-stimulated pyrophosphate-energized sodium pump
VLILFEFVAGFALGVSIVSIFSRIGGGIFAKSADLGTDIAGKICEYLDQDQTQHPGTNSANIGSIVNDIAGQGADLFGSLIEAMVAALVMSTTSWDLMINSDSVYFALVIPSVGIVACFITVQFIHIPIERIEARFRLQLFIATLI